MSVRFFAVVMFLVAVCFVSGWLVLLSLEFLFRASWL